MSYHRFVLLSVAVVWCLCATADAQLDLKTIESVWDQFRNKHKSIRIEMVMESIQRAKTISDDFPPADLERKQTIVILVSNGQIRINQALNSAERFAGRMVEIFGYNGTISFTGAGFAANAPEDDYHLGGLGPKTDLPPTLAMRQELEPLQYLIMGAKLASDMTVSSKDGRLTLVSERDGSRNELVFEESQPHLFYERRVSFSGQLLGICLVSEYYNEGTLRLPKRWECASYRQGIRKQGPKVWSAKLFVKSVEVDKHIDDSEFNFDFPPNTLVNDSRAEKRSQFIVRDDGTSRIIRPGEWRSVPHENAAKEFRRLRDSEPPAIVHVEETTKRTFSLAWVLFNLAALFGLVLFVVWLGRAHLLKEHNE